MREQFLASEGVFPDQFFLNVLYGNNQSAELGLSLVVPCQHTGTLIPGGTVDKTLTRQGGWPVKALDPRLIPGFRIENVINEAGQRDPRLERLPGDPNTATRRVTFWGD